MGINFDYAVKLTARGQRGGEFAGSGASGGQVVLGNSKRLLDAPEAIGFDAGGSGLAGQVGGVALPAGKARVLACRTRFTDFVASVSWMSGFAFDQGFPVDGAPGLGNLCRCSAACAGPDQRGIG